MRAHVAARFTGQIKTGPNGPVLGNGYQEPADGFEQKNRFEAGNKLRKNRGQPELEIDHYLESSPGTSLLFAPLFQPAHHPVLHAGHPIPVPCR